MHRFRTLAAAALVSAAGTLYAVQATPQQPQQAPEPPANPQLEAKPAAAASALSAEALPTLSETVGLLAGLQLYQTYLNVGMLADARAEGLYEASELAQLLGSVVVPLDTVDKQLAKVAALKGLSKDDAAAIARMRKIAGHLKQQGKSLQAFWDTGVEDHGKKYEEARQAAWADLDALLELSPKVGAAPEPKPAGKK
ncbi:Uncharacterized protein OS=Planctomyces brasiliensis (strain ATCC 49424 / DSM 5305 / JCM 21570 / NBRC 103401 / IFAM 1448) GN=Plabr_1930 PE=4 SV=1 [Gemmataceae bacterium]|nr:Uncharacterized protein OS=Planctomyces brasiliensis (strain ATCC 49424 / DSM 5305 / JCM 21570 / NBRC 103401 / IFAM 1448) GN=Plabr_1930 PE=4 SV=1 [Gemmataceae bacterium]VTU02240.1 Uncharacterized protein OS=Planctomyces brasiliensis (strain ATCC 49424 / DSM 5305 / JCM 21570 / NBRC 103401 / IFAM 1448) GN=Plabr_1930 PE=4 SV=1 [Gemmataceae bacterium]